MTTTYQVTIDVGTKNERRVEMTLADFLAHNAVRKAEAMAKFNADVAAAGLVNPFLRRA